MPLVTLTLLRNVSLWLVCSSCFGMFGGGIVFVEHGSPVLYFVTLEGRSSTAGIGVVLLTIGAGDIEMIDEGFFNDPVYLG